MKQEDLLDMMGELDEDILITAERSLRPGTGRIAWRIALAAAVICALCIGGAAVGHHFLNQSNSQPEASIADFSFGFLLMDQDGEFSGEIENDTVSGFTVTAKLDTDPDAPIRPEVTYTIRAPEEWVLAGAGYATTDNELSQYSITWEPHADADGVMSSWTGDDGCIVDDYVSFNQDSAYFYNYIGKNQLDYLSTIPSRVNVDVQVVTIADISMIRVDIPAFTLTLEERVEASLLTPYMKSGETRLYWSDGRSILSLVCPGWMEDSQIEELVASLYVVEDVQSYLDDLMEQYRSTREEQTK